VKGKIKVFGDNVRRLRKAKKLTQEKLAEAANCHPNYLGGIERGERNPSRKKRHKRYMSVPVNSINFSLPQGHLGFIQAIGLFR